MTAACRWTEDGDSSSSHAEYALIEILAVRLEMPM